MNMKRLVEDTITSIIKENPSQYNTEEYQSPRNKFKIIEDALMQLGTPNCITIKHMEKVVKKRRIRYIYQYQVEFNYQIVKGYKYRNSAKYRIIKEYLKLIKWRNLKKDLLMNSSLKT